MTKPKIGRQIGPNTSQEQLSNLRRQLNHRDPASLRKAVLTMFMAYRASGHDLEGSVGAYCAILADVPVDCAIRACLEFPRGKYREAIPITNAGFPPSADELHQAAELEAAYYHLELQRLETAAGIGGARRYRPARPGEKTVGEAEAEKAVAEGDMPTEEQQARFVEGFMQLAADLRLEHLEVMGKETPQARARRESWDEIAGWADRETRIARGLAPERMLIP